MAAIPTNNRILSIIIFTMIAALLTQEQQIIALAGQFGGTTLILIITIILLGVRETIKELGLTKGDLNQQDQIDEIKDNIENDGV